MNFAKFLKNIFFIQPLRTAASVPTGSIFGFLKYSLLSFFAPKLKLDIFELFWGGVMKPNEACIALKPSVAPSSCNKHKFMFSN